MAASLIRRSTPGKSPPTISTCQLARHESATVHRRRGLGRRDRPVMPKPEQDDDAPEESHRSRRGGGPVRGGRGCVPRPTRISNGRLARDRRAGQPPAGDSPTPPCSARAPVPRSVASRRRRRVLRPADSPGSSRVSCERRRVRGSQAGTRLCRRLRTCVESGGGSTPHGRGRPIFRASRRIQRYPVSAPDGPKRRAPSAYGAKTPDTICPTRSARTASAISEPPRWPMA